MGVEIPNVNTIDITLYNDGVRGVEMPLTINGIDIVGNASPLAYLERLKKALPNKRNFSTRQTPLSLWKR